MNQTLVPIGRHYFDTSDLTKYVNDAIGQLPPNRNGAIVAAVDQEGATVALEIERHENGVDWTAEAAYRHDWNGDNTAVGKVMFSW